MFKVNNKDTRTTSMMLTLNMKYLVDWSFLDSKTLKISFVANRLLSEPCQTSKMERFVNKVDHIVKIFDRVLNRSLNNTTKAIHYQAA